MSVVVPRAARQLTATSPAVVAVVGAGDPTSSRVVYAMVVGLVLVGVAFIVLAFWILRQTRPDLEVLAPLERMSDGDWKRRDPSTQRRMLDEVRPAGAQPLSSTPLPPPLDAEFDQPDHSVPSWNDLGPGLASGTPDPTPIETSVDFPGDDRRSPQASASEVPDEPMVADPPEPVEDPTPPSGEEQLAVTDRDDEPPPSAGNVEPAPSVGGDDAVVTEGDDDRGSGDHALSDPAP